jgi:superfamily II DNA or RNA helicase
MGTFLELFARLDPDPRVRGRQFEHVCKWFLANDPTYKSTLRRVWLWEEWPGRWGGDAGIDLVAEDYDGRLWAIQSKAYAPENAVTKADVDKFLSESSRSVFSYRLLIATTDKLHHVARRTIDKQEKQVAFIGLSDLLTSEVNWPTSPLDLRPSPPPKPAKPREHQREAIRRVLKGFGEANRGQLIMACGTGKTLTSLFIREKLASERTLVLVPSLSLLKQTMREWMVNLRAPFEALPVCSDETVSRSDDVSVAHTSELGLPVTTDPHDIATFLRRRSGPRVVFSTYQSSPQIAAAFAVGRVPAFDLVIADEAHRVAGIESSAFGTVLDESLIKARRRLFMTATPRYFTGRVLKAAQEADLEVASMDDPVKFGTVFHRLSFGDAIGRNLLTDYQVAVMGVDNETYREWAEKGTLVARDGEKITDARTLASQIGLAKAMRKYDLRRTISFHSRVARAREFAAEMPEIIAWTPARQRPKGALWARHASGEMSAGQRHVLLRHLSQLDDREDRGLLANARCLSEGVDVPTLDGVAFIDPRRSEVDIVQAVGRAIRKSDGKTVGTIVIPVFIDTDEDPELALDNSAFKPVWDVIKALRAHDEELGNQLDELRRELGRQRGRLRLPDKIHFDVPATVNNNFARAFDVRLVEQTTTSWEFWFGLLERFVAEYGDARVLKSHTVDGYPLGSWAQTQRGLYAKGVLDADRRQRLEVLPAWSWNPYVDQWEHGFGHLVDFVEKHGDPNVPVALEVDGYPLGQWVAVQRRFFVSGRLEHERQLRLEEVPGWTWNAQTARWEDGFRRLQQYVDRHGDALVPVAYKLEGFRLGPWVTTQRAFYVKGTLSADRQRRLEQLSGWKWDTRTLQWEEGYRHLLEYVERHGSASVPRSYRTEDGYKLGQWVTLQRAGRAKNTLNEERQHRVEQLPGWAWDARDYDDRWEEGFRRLAEYVQRYGDARVRKSCNVNGYAIGAWVGAQRVRHGKGALDAQQKHRLQGLPGWTWDARDYDEKWEEGFRRLLTYVRQHGDASVPGSYELNNYPLGDWVGVQRSRHNKGILDTERERRLQQVPGWVWDARDYDEKWEEGFSRLLRYIEQNGHALVPQSEILDEYPLGTWVANQRSFYSRGKLRADRLNRLGELATWTWNTAADKWEEGFSRLLRYIEQNGHALVPQSEILDEYPLGTWVGTQRAFHRKGKLNLDHERRLRELPGWTWDAVADQWEAGFGQLARYVERTGEARVAKSMVFDGYRLGQWAAVQRRAFAKGSLAADRQHRLQELPGWTWTASKA